MPFQNYIANEESTKQKKEYSKVASYVNLEKVITDDVTIFELLEQHEDEDNLSNQLATLVSTKSNEEIPQPVEEPEPTVAVNV